MLYYVRFFKVPTITKSYINAVVTLSNDLGDLFFYGNASIQCYLNDENLPLSTHQWRPGMQSCNIKLAIPNLRGKTQQPKRDDFILTVKVDHSRGNGPEDHLFSSSEPVILEVKSFPVCCQPDKYSIRPVYGIMVVEQTGNNLARKVWDAGISLSLYLKAHYNTLFSESRDRKLNILELGTGCGIVSNTVAQLLGCGANIVATDLSDAQEVLEMTCRANSCRVEFKEFDWEGEPTVLSQSHWDWILISDCTYNSSSYQSLLNAIIGVSSADTRVLLAHKHRHDEESEFFEMVKNRFKFIFDKEFFYFAQNVRIIELKLK